MFSLFFAILINLTGGGGGGGAGEASHDYQCNNYYRLLCLCSFIMDKESMQ